MGKTIEKEPISQKQILAVHDFATHGTTSLGIIIPILTAFNHKITILPTTILSSTTDIDPNPITVDTTEWMSKVINLWNGQGMTFDAVYTGWLGNPEQFGVLTQLFETSRHKKTTIFVDPVLGDLGKLYPLRETLFNGMSQFIANAHIATPNATEGAFLLQRCPLGSGINEDGTINVALAEDMITNLSHMFPETLTILKSVAWKDKLGVCVGFTPDNTSKIRRPKIKTVFASRARRANISGTGDLFASLLVGRWLQQSLCQQSSLPDKLALIRSCVETVSQIISDEHYHNSDTLPFNSLSHIMRNLNNS